MGLRTGFTAHTSRLPDRLDDLHGPWQGTVVLVSNQMRRAWERKLGLRSNKLP
jgi:hypothetical protein